MDYPVCSEFSKLKFSLYSFVKLRIKTNIRWTDSNFPIKRRGKWQIEEIQLYADYRRTKERSWKGLKKKFSFWYKARGCTQRSKISRGRYNRKRPIISILQRSDPLTISGSERNLGQQEENLCSPSPISLPIRYSVPWLLHPVDPSILISSFNSNYLWIKFWSL